jgi:hypothetical protein
MCMGFVLDDVGDGEPDEDFPPLERGRMLKQFGNVSEYCLCVKMGVPVPPLPPRPFSEPVTVTKPSTLSVSAVVGELHLSAWCIWCRLCM